MKSNEKLLLNKIRNLFIGILIVAIAFFSVYLFARPVIVQGDSMLPTYEAKKLLFMNTVIAKYKVNDVIVFNYGDKILIKRIVAIEGDKIKIDNGVLFINEELICECAESDIQNTSYTIAESQYFVLGDNQDKSTDSRYFGCVKQKNIIGRIY